MVQLIKQHLYNACSECDDVTNSDVIEQVSAGQPMSTMTGGGYSLSVVGVGGSRSVMRQSLLLLALLAVCTAVLASSSTTCRRLPLARVVVFIPPVFRLGQSTYSHQSTVYTLFTLCILISASS